MAKTFTMTPGRRIANGMMQAALRLGFGPPGIYLLATKGRHSGKLHVHPVTPIEVDGQRWLVAPYGVRDWVRNVRANPRIQLKRGRRREDLEAREASPAEAAPILKRYVNELAIVRPYIEVEPDAPVEEFERIVNRHPVFRVVDPNASTS